MEKSRIAPPDLAEAQRNAVEHAGEYIKTHPLGLGALDEDQFKSALARIQQALITSWAAGYMQRDSEVQS